MATVLPKAGWKDATSVGAAARVTTGLAPVVPVPGNATKTEGA